MESYIKDDWLVIALTHQETCTLNTGTSIHDRLNPLWSEAKVEVRPLVDIDPEYRPAEVGSREFEDRLSRMGCVAEIFSNLDVTVSVPPEVSSYALIAAEAIPRSSVVTLVEGAQRENLVNSLPENGVMIRFDGRTNV